MKTLITVALLFMALAGCDLPRPQEVQTTSNPSYEVELLFEHDGVKVYSFRDAGRNIYYTDARGGTQWLEVIHHGEGNTEAAYYTVSTAE